MTPLLLSGSSYLIPTLRIERSDSPESIETRIATALEEGSNHSVPNTGVVKSMLRGKTTTSGGRWQAPIILDLSALVPDGSPHYSPPQGGLLVRLVTVLEEYGIRVVGVTNTPPTLEEEAVKKLGLPAFMSKGRVLDRQSATSKVKVEDVVNMLLVKTQEESEVEENNESVTATESQELVNDTGATEATAIEDEKQNDTPVASEDVGNIGDGTGSIKDDNDASVPSPQGGTYVYHGSVRTGQQVVAQQNQSLIVIGSVNSGGEVMSDRDIFVFGKLRGRALAGLASTEKDEESARIFASSFDAELICIGDTFTTVDSVSELGLDKPGEAAMVTLDSNRELVFEHIPL